MTLPVVATTQGWQCVWCQKDVPYTPMRQVQVNRLVSKGIEPRVWCGRQCSTAFYNDRGSKLRVMKRIDREIAKRMDGV